MTTAPVANPLMAGERLTRAEFHRRYCNEPDLHGVELLEGVVYMPSPARFSYHGRQQALILAWLGSYESTHPGVSAAGPCTVLLDDANEVEPDALLFHTSNLHLEDGYVVAAPDLAVEISASTIRRDAVIKRRVYERAGVREYLLWRVNTNVIDWFTRVDDAYEPLAAVDGVIESLIFPGLRLDVAAALAGDAAAMLKALQR